MTREWGNAAGEPAKMSKPQLLRLVGELLRERESENELAEAVLRLKVSREEDQMQSEQLMEAQRQLERAICRYSDLYDNAPIAYATLDQYGLIAEINLTGAELFRYERGALYRQHLVLFIRGQADRTAFFAHMACCRRGALGPIRTRLNIEPLAGTPIPIELYSVRVPELGTDGGPMFRTAFLDMTDRVRAEEVSRLAQDELERRVAERTRELERSTHVLEQEIRERAALEDKLLSQTRELERVDQLKDEFLAMLGHELRTPLSPMVAAVHLLRTTRPGERPFERGLDLMDRQLKHMVRLIDDLLDISRITRGKIPIKKQEIAMSDVVSQAVDAARPTIEALRHELCVSIPAEKVIVDADSVRLTQVMTNLLNNAAKFTPPGGKIRFSLDVLEGSAVFRVTDTGIGIDPAMLPHVFEPFFQAERTLDRTRGGLGLGLSICHALIQLHGGTINAHSPGIGLGTTFTVTLPDVREDAKAAVEVAAPHPSQSSAEARPLSTAAAGLRIMIVDDNRDAADNIAELLIDLSHQVRVVYTGASAIETAAEFHPELVLLDLGLPGMDGYEVAKQLRKVHGDHDMMIVAVTGYGEPEARRRTKEAGFDQHVLKPLGIQELETVLASRSTQ